MASLINSIPVRKPQNNVQNNTQNTFKNIKNPYPQIEKYEYIPAKPISPARTRTKFTRPVAASGRILNENVFQSAARTVKSYGQYAQNFYNAAFKGEGNDYKVGKINDLSIRAGSLGIASIIATTKFFPFAKGMEFVGLGTWFAAMALWPQIIGAPIKALTGVNINQKYKDNYGRVKCVFEDNQYRPMDIYRHLDENGKQLEAKEYYEKYQFDYVYLDKLADKLGIPKDNKNRHEAVMEKMGQIAVQGRTLTMLTAGVMTPVLSSVAADALQNPFKKIIGSFREHKNLSNINRLDNAISILDTSTDLSSRKTETNLDEILKKLDIEIPQETINKLDSLLSKDYLTESEYEKLNEFMKNKVQGTLFEEPFELYTNNSLSYHEPQVSLNKSLFSKLQESTSKTVKTFISKLDKELVDTIPESIKNYNGISEEEFIAAIKESMIKADNAPENAYRNQQVYELNTEKITALKDTVIEKVSDFLRKEKLDESAISLVENNIEANLIEVINKEKHHVVNQNKDKIKNFFKFIEINKALRNKITAFEEATIADISESVTANNWEKVPTKYLDIIGFEKNEIAKLATMEPSQASKIISNKFEKIAANDAEYKKVIKEMSKVAKEAINKEEKAVMTLLGTMKESGILTKIKSFMSSVANHNFSKDVEKHIELIYSNQMKKVLYKFRNTTDSFVRPIKALDTFKFISENADLILGHNQQEFEQALKNPHYYMFSNMNYETAKKSLITLIKNIALDKNDINNWTTKMEQDIPGAKKGIKHSLELLIKIANIVNGSLDKETAAIIDEEESRTAKDFFKNKQYKNSFKKYMQTIEEKTDKNILKILRLNQITDEPLKFSQKIDLNNSIMRFRFLNITNELTKDFESNICYMRDYFPSESMLKDICNGNQSNLFFLKGWLSELREQINMEGIREIKNVIDTIEQNHTYILHDNFAKNGDGIKGKTSTIFGNLNFDSASKEISEMTGKNLTDFITDASKNCRSRSKWMKVAYGLLIGTTALTGLFMLLIGKDNNFNKSRLEPTKTKN